MELICPQCQHQFPDPGGLPITCPNCNFVGDAEEGEGMEGGGTRGGFAIAKIGDE